MRKWKIHLLHHTHFDIGYTHTQEEVFHIRQSSFHLAANRFGVARSAHPIQKVWSVRWKNPKTKSSCGW